MYGMCVVTYLHFKKDEVYISVLFTFYLMFFVHFNLENPGSNKSQLCSLIKQNRIQIRFIFCNQCHKNRKNINI